jgi:hypothetical protein
MQSDEGLHGSNIPLIVAESGSASVISEHISVFGTTGATA